MFGKRIKNESNANDKMIISKHDECRGHLEAIKTFSEEVYLINQTIEFYAPNTPDREAEEKALDKARYSLLCAIGGYDAATAEYKRMLANIPQEKRITTYGYIYDWLDSHELIRRHIKNFIK